MSRDSPQDVAGLCCVYLWQRANVAVLEVSAAGVIRKANAYAETLAGSVLPGRMLGELIVDLVPGASPERWWQPCDDIRLVNMKTASGLPQTFYATVWPLDDGVLWCAQIDGTEQEVLRKQLLGLNRELSQLSRELALSNAELERLDALKNQFLGMASHDLRRPVGLMLTYAEFLHESAASVLTPEQLRYLDIIRTSADRMERMIEDFLDISMIEAGRFPIETRPVDVPALIDEVLRFAEIPSLKRSVSLTKDIEAGILLWQADGPKLEQVLANLLGNAIEASPPRTEVCIGCRREGEGLEFRVSDQGPGLDDAMKKKLFQAFAGTARMKSDGQRSVGLGLVIAERIVAAHGGAIRVDSAPGRGTTFIFTLPPPKTPAPEGEGLNV